MRLFFKSCVEFCGQLLGGPPIYTIRCSSRAWPHLSSAGPLCSSFPANEARAPALFHDKRHNDYSYPRPCDGALLGALGQTLHRQRLSRHCRELARTDGDWAVKPEGEIDLPYVKLKMAECKNVIGESGCIGLLLLDGQVGFMVNRPSRT
jgi:hypothetical protein